MSKGPPPREPRPPIPVVEPPIPETPDDACLEPRDLEVSGSFSADVGSSVGVISDGGRIFLVTTREQIGPIGGRIGEAMVACLRRGFRFHGQVVDASAEGLTVRIYGAR